jgi:NAD(P)-dependent dehydrogenase (short-subunit alcohol dehydrogenase family)
MKLTGNTIFITGGGSGIGRGLAEALHKLGNQIIISGRRKSHLDATTKANPGIASLELNIEDPASIAAVTKKLVEQFPSLNVLINNAGIMQIDDAAGGIDDGLLVSTVTTNLLGPIRPRSGASSLRCPRFSIISANAMLSPATRWTGWQRTLSRTIPISQRFRSGLGKSTPIVE